MRIMKGGRVHPSAAPQCLTEVWTGKYAAPSVGNQKYVTCESHCQGGFEGCIVPVKVVFRGLLELSTGIFGFLYFFGCSAVAQN